MIIDEIYPALTDYDKSRISPGSALRPLFSLARMFGAHRAKDGDGGINAPRVHPRIYHEAGDNVTINCRIIIPPFVIPSHYPSMHHHP